MAFKKRIKIILEDVPEKKQKRKQARKVHINKYRKIYDESLRLKEKLITDNMIYNYRSFSSRAEYLYNHDYFQAILENMKKIKRYEKSCKTRLFLFLLLFFLLLLLGLIFHPEFVLFKSLYTTIILLLFPVLLALFFSVPKVTYACFYKNIFLEVCALATCLERRSLANFKFHATDSKFNISNTGEWSRNKPITIKSFKISSPHLSAHIRQIIMRDIINQYIIRKGKLKSVKKKVTIFAGYSFETKSDLSNKRPEEIVIAVVNNDTFDKVSPFTYAEQDMLEAIEITHPLLKKEWTVYVNKNYDISKDLIKELQKKVIELYNSIGSYNLYINNNSIRLLMNIKENRGGLQTEYFTDIDIEHANRISFEGFKSNVKALYIYSFVNRIYLYLDKKNFYKGVGKNER